MSLFEFSFALSAVILGMALTHIAAVAHKLLLAGKRVSWAPEPVLLTLLVMLVIIGMWLGSWDARNETSIGVASTVVDVVILMALYFTAASCLPEPRDNAELIDTHAYYNRTRLLSFGSIIFSYLLFQANYFAIDDWNRQTITQNLANMVLIPVLYSTLIFIRARWFNIAILASLLLFFGWNVMGERLSST